MFCALCTYVYNEGLEAYCGRGHVGYLYILRNCGCIYSILVMGLFVGRSIDVAHLTLPPTLVVLQLKVVVLRTTLVLYKKGIQKFRNK